VNTENTETGRLTAVTVEERVSFTSAEGQRRETTVKVPALKDPETGEIYFGTDATEILDRAKARLKGVLAPNELARLRARLGLTQKQIAALLQIGEKTWTRWETGTETPSRSLNLLLLALSEGKVTLPWLHAKSASNNAPWTFPSALHSWWGQSNVAVAINCDIATERPWLSGNLYNSGPIGAEQLMMHLGQSWSAFISHCAEWPASNAPALLSSRAPSHTHPASLSRGRGPNISSDETTRGLLSA
jgi:DNA-binding transcriptional regulator YiaG